jgi:hypothetical protein
MPGTIRLISAPELGWLAALFGSRKQETASKGNGASDIHRRFPVQEKDAAVTDELGFVDLVGMITASLDHQGRE